MRTPADRYRTQLLLTWLGSFLAWAGLVGIEFLVYRQHIRDMRLAACDTFVVAMERIECLPLAEVDVSTAQSTLQWAIVATTVVVAVGVAFLTWRWFRLRADLRITTQQLRGPVRRGTSALPAAPAATPAAAAPRPAPSEAAAQGPAPDSSPTPTPTAPQPAPDQAPLLDSEALREAWKRPPGQA